MERLLRDNPLMIVSTVMMLGWFIITCIRVYFPKRSVYIAEMVALFINIVGDILLAYAAAEQYKTLEQCVIFVAWGVACLVLLLTVFYDFYICYYYDPINDG